MKASLKQETPHFVPVILELETQEEVDKIFTLLNCGPVPDAIGLKDAYQHLVIFSSVPRSNNYHKKLMDNLRKHFETSRELI